MIDELIILLERRHYH